MQLVNVYEARSILLSGGILLYPTETFYALGSCCISATHRAEELIFSKKRRNCVKRLPAIAQDMAQVDQYAVVSPHMRALWYCFPHITQIIPIRSQFRSVLGDTMAVRLAVTPLLHELTSIGSIFSTSANISGNNPERRLFHIEHSLRESIPICVTRNRTIPIVYTQQRYFTIYSQTVWHTKKIQPSTIVSVQKGTITIIRHGNVTQKDLQRAGFSVQ